MDEEETPWHTSNNYSNRRNSVVSLERNSRMSRERSLNHKKSFVQVLNIDGMEEEEMNSDLFQQMLMENQRRSFFRSSNNSQYAQGEMEIEEPANYYNRRSSNTKFLYHECICQGSCIDYHCACFEAQNQLCLQGSCCQGCIDLKNKMLSQLQIPVVPVCICKEKKGKYANCKCFKNGTFECDCSCPENTKNKKIIQSKKQKHYHNQSQESPSSYQQGLRPNKTSKNQQKNKQKNKLVCYCKKSHCLKKYCCCYAQGQQCNQQCSCTECHNQFQEDQDKQEKKLERQRFGRHNSDNQDSDIDQYIQDKNYENYEMPKSMQFQHPDITKSFRH